MIRVKNLRISLSSFVMKNINLEINTGEYFILIGPTGCWKTVLIETLVGIRKPDSGEIWINNQNVTSLFPEERNVGYLPQDFALFPNMTVAENIAFGLKARRKEKKYIQSVINRLADSLNISHLLLRYTQGLSGGEKQRVALARALATEPEVVFLDEPLSSVDENSREILCNELKEIHSRFKTTFIHVSHSFEEVSEMADRIAVINRGAVEQVDTVENIIYHPVNRFVAQFTRTKNIFKGTIKGNEIFINENIRLKTKYKTTGNVLITIRQEVIKILEELKEGYDNVFTGKIVNLKNRNNIISIVIDIGIPITLYTMDYELVERIKSKSIVYIRIPIESINVINV
ncbi:MAG: ABC transporter ATP-binding protein [Candidatus Brocadiaceae bacterium]|nr:ABC transporter ATP-binding protein [Candidatus Brocadiaceae bacterium]